MSIGGNRKPQTFKVCAQCGRTFGPVDHLTRRFCSRRCKGDAQRVGVRRRSVATTAARRAQRRIRWLVESGQVIKPSRCEECGEEKRLEAAHVDYAYPELVRWLCTSCHRRWDKKRPKGGTVTGEKPSRAA